MGSFKFLSMMILLYSSGWLVFASTRDDFFYLCPKPRCFTRTNSVITRPLRRAVPS